jgi:DNA polymerase (family 10)
MAKGNEIQLGAAQQTAEKLVSALRPFCQAVEIAGSIRRQRPIVHDIDLVAIPRDFEEHKLQAALAEGADQVLRDTSAKIWKAVVGGIPVDLYLAQPSTWATLLVIRTGSAQHNIWLASRAMSLGLRLRADGSGIERKGKILPCPTEADLFRQLDVPMLEPGLREVRHGRPVWLEGR